MYTYTKVMRVSKSTIISQKNFFYKMFKAQIVAHSTQWKMKNKYVVDKCVCVDPADNASADVIPKSTKTSIPLSDDLEDKGCAFDHSLLIAATEVHPVGFFVSSTGVSGTRILR